MKYNFSDFEAKFMVKNRVLMSLLVISLFLSGISLIYLTFSRDKLNLIYKEDFNQDDLIEVVCRHGFLAILNNRLDSRLLERGIINLLKKDPYLLKIDQIYKISAYFKNKCKVIIGHKGNLRSFEVKLIKNPRYPYFFKLDELIEQNYQEKI